MRKVCLINPPTSDSAGSSMYFPMALLSLAGVLKTEGVASELWDLEYYFHRREKQVCLREFSELIEYGVTHAGTQVFCISAICANFPMAVWIAREIKRYRPEAIVILGGPQPSAVYSELLACYPSIDAVVVGEGEETLAKLARAGFTRESLAQIAGIAARTDGEVRFSPRPLVKDMDRLPMPDYSLIDYAKYADLGSSKAYAHIEAGRGCPFTCTFCSTALMWQRRFRMKSPARILEEARWLNRHWGITHFDLIHDNWTTSARYVEDFCTYWKAHADPSWRWYASSRTDCLTREQLRRMTEAGLGGLFFGIEVGSPRMQRTIDKCLDLDGFDDFVRDGTRLGLGLVTAFIIGFPEEVEDDIDATIKLAVRCKVAGAQRSYFSTLAPLAGTQIYKRCSGQMRLLPFTSPLNPLCAAEPDIQEMVTTQPGLFSFFYHVIHPLFSPEEFYCMAQTANAVATHVPRQADLLWSASHRTPLQLFRGWQAWLDGRGITTADNPWGHRFRRLFQEFLAEAVFTAGLSGGSTDAVKSTASAVA